MLLIEIPPTPKCPKCHGENLKNNVCIDCKFVVTNHDEDQIPKELHWYASEIESLFNKIFLTNRRKTNV